MYPQIYLGYTPSTTHARRTLRTLALDLRSRLHAARATEPTTLLLHFAAGAPAPEPVDLLLLRPSTVIVGAVRAYSRPITALPGGRWSDAASGVALREQGDRSPLQHVQLQRDAVRDRLEQEVADMIGAAPGTRPFARTIGALICAPTTHPDSQISLDVGDHRRALKVLGLDELPALAGMVHISAQLPDTLIRAIAAELFAGRLWHDGSRFLFDLAAPRFQLRVLPEHGRAEKVLPLIEGENVIGRRRSVQQYEHRLTLTGDELISGDYALLSYGDDNVVTVRDNSKNGTWVTPPGGSEERVHTERALGSGTLLRMGATLLRLERNL